MKPQVSKKEQRVSAVSSKCKAITRKLRQTTVMTALPIVAVMAMAGNASAAIDRIPVIGEIVKIPTGLLNSVVDPIQNAIPLSKWYFAPGPFGQVGPDGTSQWHVLKDAKVTSLLFPAGVKVGMWGGSLLASTSAQLENVVINKYSPYGVGIWAFDHTKVALNNVTVNAKGPGTWLFGVVGLKAWGVDSQIVGDGLAFNGVRTGVHVKGDPITGNLPFAKASNVTLNNVSINAWHKGADVKGVVFLGGIFGRQNQPTLNMSNFNINVTGRGLLGLVGGGVMAHGGGIANIDTGMVTVTGSRGNLGFEPLCYFNISCPSAGIAATGGSLLGSNSIVTANNVVVQTSGKRIPGLSAWGNVLGGNPTINGTNLLVSTNGHRSYGAYSSGALFRFLRHNDALVNVTGIGIATAGEFSYGAFAVSNGKVELTGVAGADANTSNYNLIYTSGKSSYGVYARGESSRVTLTDMRVQTEGDSAHGVAVKGRSFLGSLPLVGDLAASILGGKNATAVLNGSSVYATGTNAHGIYSGPRSIGRDIPIIGDFPLYSDWVDTLNIDLAAGGDVVLNNSSVYSAQGYGVYSDKATFGTKTNVAASGSTIGGAAGAFRVKANTFTILGIGANTMNLSLTDGSTLVGRGLTETGSGFLGLFKGKATSNVLLSGASTWLINGNSNVTNLSLTDSAVAFAPNGFGDENLNGGFNILKVDKTFSSTNGAIRINAQLGSDDSPTDRVNFAGGVAEGNTTNVYVSNRGGLGAQTMGNGIEILRGATGGAFNLIGDYATKKGQQVVVGGAYAYSMYKGGIVTPVAKAATAAPKSGFIRSLLGNFFGGGIQPAALAADPTANSYFLRTTGYQAGAPVYEALPQVLQQMNTLPTLQQRVGNRQWVGVQDPKPFKKGALTTVEPGDVVDGRGFWIRVEGGTGEFNSSKSTAQMKKYNLDQIKVQAGVDFVLGESEGGTWIAGLFGQYGHGKADVKSAYANGKITTDAYGFGGTLTWYGNTDWYIDAQAQVNWFNTDLRSTTASRALKNDEDGMGYAVSIETGKKIALNHDWSMTPQVQLAWNSVDFDDFHDTWGAKVSAKDGDSLLGRAGLSFDRQTQWTGENGKTQRLQTYVIGNLYYEFLDDGTKVKVSNVTFKHENDQFWGGIGAGLTYNWADDMYSVYGNVDARSSFDDFGNTYVIGGAVGFRVKF